MSVNGSCSESLKALMSNVGVQSFRSLAQRSGVSWRQIERVRRGQIRHLSVKNVMRLAATLNLTLIDFLDTFDSSSASSSGLATSIKPLNNTQSSQAMALMEDYRRLEQAFENQRSQLLEIFQSDVLNSLESLILQWPTAVYAAQNNPALPALRLIPLLKPLDRLLKDWEIEAISGIGEMVLYDPTLHQWGGETAPPEMQHPVQVSHVGYRQRERLLYRAKVRLPKPDTV
jgi:molecular chaperone GrpE (heat shock protein)